MPNIVTFDTTRLLIIEIPVIASPTTSPETLADNTTSFQEIYSEWKEFVAKTAGSPSTGSLGFPPAIRVVGGDPTSEIENLGITYFVTNGWRLKPAEGNHRWTVDGNVFTDPAGQSIFVPTDGPFTVNVENKVTNLLDGLRAIGDDAETARKILQNRTHTDPNTGIMTVYDDDDSTVFLQGDLFEDVDATQPYRGQGAERRNRLT
jgi:hypothetical protein